MTEERINEMERLFWAESNDPETEEWREDLTEEEAALVAKWDEQVEKGMTKLARDILDLEEKQQRRTSVEYQMAAAKAEQLRQRAKRLPEAEDIVRRLEDLMSVARRAQEAEHWQVNEKGLADNLNALEGEIRAREAQQKREQKQDRALVNAAGDLADGLVDHLPR